MKYYEAYNNDEKSLHSMVIQVYREEGFKILLRKTLTHLMIRLDHMFTNKNFYVGDREFRYFINLYNSINEVS